MLEFLETHRYQQYRHRGKYADLHQHKRNIHSSIISLRTAWIYQRAGSTTENSLQDNGHTLNGEYHARKQHGGHHQHQSGHQHGGNLRPGDRGNQQPQRQETKMNSSDTTTSQNKLPATGTSST